METEDIITIKPIKRFIEIYYIENDGAAWGMLGGKTWVLVAITAVIMIALVYLMIKYAKKNKIFFWSASLIISGGIGNMIDRIFNQGYVTDFLHFTFIDFPVFNVADITVCIGAGLLILYFVIDTIKEQKEKSQKQGIEEGQE